MFLKLKVGHPPGSKRVRSEFWRTKERPLSTSSKAQGKHPVCPWFPSWLPLVKRCYRAAATRVTSARMRSGTPIALATWSLSVMD
jgi:hypothetical protein